MNDQDERTFRQFSARFAAIEAEVKDAPPFRGTGRRLGVRPLTSLPGVAALLVGVLALAVLALSTSGNVPPPAWSAPVGGSTVAPQTSTARGATPQAAVSQEPIASTTTWGPLAVVPAQPGTATARNEGVLRVTDTCVFLDTAGGPELLVWPADRTTWNDDAKSVTFANFDGTTETVTDGTAVVLGGGGDSTAESGVTPEAWLAQTSWIARPAASCPLDVRFSVGGLER